MRISTYSNSVDLLSAYASSLSQICFVFRAELHHFLKLLSRKPLFVTLFNIDLKMLQEKLQVAQFRL